MENFINPSRMPKLLLFVVFCITFGLRWLSVESSLPLSWTPEKVVRYTAPIIDRPEHTDTKTIVHSGRWQLEMRGYAEIIPGDLVSFVGNAKTIVLGKRVVKIVMENPTFEIVAQRDGRRLGLVERNLVWLDTLRESMVKMLQKFMPEPMSSLAAGILLGVKGQMPRDFYEALVSTGTLHIIAASGYNVAVVASVIVASVGTIFPPGIAIGVAILSILVYVLLAGVSASVVRAGIMGSLTLIAYYFGRPAEARRLLWVSAVIMLLIQPLMLIDIGFQLSLTATAGILYIEPWIRNKLAISNARLGMVKDFLGEYLYPTLAATLGTLPVILWHFGRVPLISPLVNMLVLPLVPLVMGMTAGVIAAGYATSQLGQVMAWFLYPPLAYIIWVIKWLGGDM